MDDGELLLTRLHSCFGPQETSNPNGFTGGGLFN